MVRVNINGESYKVRNREVNGKEQQIYYKDGKAYIKEGNELKELRKTKDSVFSKAEYKTAEYQLAERREAAHRANKYREGGDAQVYTRSDLYNAINKTVTIDGRKGVVKQDAGKLEDTYSNYNLVSEYTGLNRKGEEEKTVITSRINYTDNGQIDDLTKQSVVRLLKNPDTGEYVEYRKTEYNDDGTTTHFKKDENGNWVELKSDNKPNMGV